MEFDFDKWMGVLDEDNKADEYYADDEAYMYCDECDNLMVPTGDGEYKCPVCGCTDRKSTRLNSSHRSQSRMPSSA